MLDNNLDNSIKKTFSIDELPEEVKFALQQSKEHFDKNPPRAFTKEEIDEFFNSL